MALSLRETSGRFRVYTGRKFQQHANKFCIINHKGHFRTSYYSYHLIICGSYSAKQTRPNKCPTKQAGVFVTGHNELILRHNASSPVKNSCSMPGISREFGAPPMPRNRLGVLLGRCRVVLGRLHTKAPAATILIRCCLLAIHFTVWSYSLSQWTHGGNN